MKISVFLFLTGIISIYADNSYSQTTRLSLDLRETAVGEVLTSIENQSEFYFLYSNKLIDVNRKVSLRVKNKPVSNILDHLFADTDVRYVVFDRQIILSPKEMLKKTIEQQNAPPQGIVVTGVVTDKDGNTLPGVNIVVKGTITGTITDMDGNYNIEVDDLNATLVFSFMGMKNEEVLVGAQTTINMTMVDDFIRLDDVVAIGYGTRSKRFVTGSISSVDMEVTKRLAANTNVAQSLVHIPGVQFISDGRPGQGGAILIRGQNSLSAENNPLIVLDGIIFEGELSDINPQDIKAIDVLKDAASASIYGSRAANGVIMITSVKGTTTKPTIRINTTYGISEAGNWVDLMTMDGYFQRKLDFYEQRGLVVDPNNPIEFMEPEEVKNYENGVWQDPFKDIISRQGSIATFDLSVSGRSDRTNYLLSASLSDDVGLIKGDQEKRQTVRINVDNDITDWLTIGTTSTYVNRDQSGIPANLRNAYRNSPLGTWYYPDGSVTQYPVPTEQASGNCMYNVELSENTEARQNLFSNLYADVDIPFVEGLSLRFNYSPNFQWNHNYTFMKQDPYVTYNNSYAEKYNSSSFRWVWENILTYERSIGENHDFDLTLLYGRDHYEFESTEAKADQLYLDLLGYDNLGLGSIFTNSSNAIDKNGVSSMARLNYMFHKKYMLTLTVRRDGSSVFAAKNKFAAFPSVALAWIASEEQFIMNTGFIDFLKFKVSYGTLGNEAIQPYQSKSLARTTRYVFGDGGSSTLGVITSTLGNESLKWETVYSTNLGVDFGVFDGRLSGSIEFYNSNTKNLLVERVIPEASGFESIMTNIGQTNNKGIELTLNTVNIQKSKFQWNSSLSYSYNKNKIVKLFGDVDGDGTEDDVIANSWFIGENINSYYDYEFDGIYQEDDDIPAPFVPGDVRVKDLNGDGAITPDDRTVVGHGQHPIHAFTFTNTLSYGNLSLYVSMNSMLNWMAPFNLINPLVPERAFNALDAGYWTPENRSNTRPSLIYTDPLNTRWLFSRDFLRIRDVALSYDFQRMNLDILSGFSSLRLTLSVKNLYTFTGWLGPDPESGGEGTTSEQGASDLWPMPRTYSLGINLGF